MKNVKGIWLPDSEMHMVEWIEREGGYQLKKQALAASYVTQWRCAVDVGAHCGTWALNLVKRFETVHCFEPIPEHLECLKMNAPKAVIHEVPLGERGEYVSFRKNPKSTGDASILPSGKGDTRTAVLDDFDLQNVDFMKLDCEGYEVAVLKGALRTIIRCRPVIVVEQKPGKGSLFGYGDTEAVSLLESLGAKLRESMSGDYILSW